MWSPDGFQQLHALSGLLDRWVLRRTRRWAAPVRGADSRLRPAPC